VAFFAMKREEIRTDRRRHREYAERELENPNTTEDFEDEDGKMFNNLWSETTSDDDEYSITIYFLFKCNF
jgi:hypothetical protein